MLNILIAIGIIGIAAFIDNKERIVPDWLSVGGIIVGIALSWLYPSIHDSNNQWLGALSATGDCFLVICGMCWYASLTEHLLKCDTLGGGDIKIMGALATILNWKITFCILLLSPVIGLIHFAIERIKYEIYGLPYCPSIFVATIFSLVFWKSIIGIVS